MSLIKPDHLDNYLRLNYNVLLSGRHGIGKTEIIKGAFGRAGLRWKYFSASTMDPWVDLIGVPETRVRSDGARVLDLVRPEFIVDDTIEAIFFDELNRAPDKVLNAIMELIQFKSINGHKLKNLRVVWGAINPADEDGTYAVNKLDPAMLDRFQIQRELEYKLDEEYFMKKYPMTAPAFIGWWKNLPDEMQKEVSPRRLDYAAGAHSENCRLDDFLPKKSNVKKLREALNTVPFQQVIASITTAEAAQAFLRNPNNATAMLDLVKINDASSNQFFESFGTMLPKELVQPFAEFVYARKQGMMVIKSIEGLIDAIPDKRGDASTAALINNIDLDGMFLGQTTGLRDELKKIKRDKSNKLSKLATRLCDVLFNCQVNTLSGIMWGIGGLDAGKPTNFQRITKAISEIDTEYAVISEDQRKKINSKLYQEQRADYRVFPSNKWLH